MWSTKKDGANLKSSSSNSAVQWWLRVDKSSTSKWATLWTHMSGLTRATKTKWWAGTRWRFGISRFTHILMDKTSLILFKEWFCRCWERRANTNGRHHSNQSMPPSSFANIGFGFQCQIPDDWIERRFARLLLPQWRKLQSDPAKYSGHTDQIQSRGEDAGC